MMSSLLNLNRVQFKYQRARAYFRMRLGKCTAAEMVLHFEISEILAQRWVDRFETEYKKDINERKRK